MQLPKLIVQSVEFTKKANQNRSKSIPLEIFSGKSVLKICSKFTEDHPHRSVISVKLLYSSIEITLWHGRCLVNLLNILEYFFIRTPTLESKIKGWVEFLFKKVKRGGWNFCLK